MPAVVDDGGGTVVDRGLPAVAGDEHRVVGEADRLARREDLLDRALDGEPGQLVDDAEDLPERPADGLRLRPAAERLGDRVQERDQPSASVAITASPMLARATRQYSRCSKNSSSSRFRSVMSRVKHRVWMNFPSFQKTFELMRT